MISVTAINLKKTYDKGTVVAVDEISFSVNRGELFGLIGPDGAGKTSIFRMLTTLLLPDSGTATVDGHDIVKDYKAIRGSVGYMPGRFSLYQDLTVEENLSFFATVFGTTIKENNILIKDIYSQLEPFKDRMAGQLSGGMKQKLALCCALIHKPSVLFLDEPTTGVDAVSRKEFWEMLQRLKKQNITTLVSTPYMDEATLCDRIALIQSGKILTIDTTENIVNAYAGNLFEIRSDDMHGLVKDLRAYEQTLSCFAFGEYLHLSIKKDGESERSEVVNYLKEIGQTNLEMKICTPTIEDCFIKMTGH